MHRPNGIGTLTFGTKGGLRQRTVPLGSGLGDPATTETLADACVRVQTHARMHTLYVCTYRHTHVCTHCMCVRTHTHTHSAHGLVMTTIKE